VSGGEARGLEALPAGVRHRAAEGDAVAQHDPPVGRRAGVPARHRWGKREEGEQKQQRQHEEQIHYNDAPLMMQRRHSRRVCGEVSDAGFAGNTFNYGPETEVTGFGGSCFFLDHY